jgi:hypothetical protein
MQTETAHSVQLVLFVSYKQFCNCLFVSLGTNYCWCVVAATGNAESSRKVLPPSWLDFFQDG